MDNDLPPHSSQRFADYRPDAPRAKPVTGLGWWLTLLGVALFVGVAVIVAMAGFVAVLKAIAS